MQHSSIDPEEAATLYVKGTPFAKARDTVASELAVEAFKPTVVVALRTKIRGYVFFHRPTIVAGSHLIILEPAFELNF